MIVVDASVVFKWIKPDEEDSKDAIELYNQFSKEKEEIVVPRFLFLEVANALSTKSNTINKTIQKNIEFLYKLPLIIYQEDKKDVLKAAKFAKKYKTSVYDMLYAVVAKRKKIQFITADTKFKEKTKFSFVKTLKDKI